MSFWVSLSWILVAVLTAINVVVFLKLKGASEQMMKMAFPNAKNMGDAMNQMQKMMQGMGGMQGFGGKGGKGAPSDAQLKAAMEMLSRSKR